LANEVCLTNTVLQVMRVLQSAPHLLQLLKEVEQDLSRYTGQAGRRPEGAHADVLPFLVTQGNDWEAYATSGQPSTSHQVPPRCPAASISGMQISPTAKRAPDFCQKSPNPPQKTYFSSGGLDWETYASIRPALHLPAGVTSVSSCIQLGNDQPNLPNRPRFLSA
jgi:hypothetical protein